VERKEAPAVFESVPRKSVAAISYADVVDSSNATGQAVFESTPQESKANVKHGEDEEEWEYEDDE